MIRNRERDDKVRLSCDVDMCFKHTGWEELWVHYYNYWDWGRNTYGTLLDLCPKHSVRTEDMR